MSYYRDSRLPLGWHVTCTLLMVDGIQVHWTSRAIAAACALSTQGLALSYPPLPSKSCRLLRKGRQCRAGPPPDLRSTNTSPPFSPLPVRYLSCRPCNHSLPPCVSKMP